MPIDLFQLAHSRSRSWTMTITWAPRHFFWWILPPALLAGVALRNTKTQRKSGAHTLFCSQCHLFELCISSPQLNAAPLSGFRLSPNTIVTSTSICALFSIQSLHYLHLCQLWAMVMTVMSLKLSRPQHSDELVRMPLLPCPPQLGRVSHKCPGNQKYSIPMCWDLRYWNSDLKSFWRGASDASDSCWKWSMGHAMLHKWHRRSQSCESLGTPAAASVAKQKPAKVWEADGPHHLNSKSGHPAKHAFPSHIPNGFIIHVWFGNNYSVKIPNS